MERLAGREWEWRIDVWRQARSFTWKVPGRVLVEGDGSTYELLDDGTIVFTTPSSDGPVTYSFTVNADGTWQRHVDPDPSVLQYIRAEDKRRLEIWRAEPSGQISIWSKHPDDPYPRLQSILLPADGSGGNEIRIGRQLGAPAEWGPMARLANRTTGDPSVGQHIVHVPGADGNVLYSAYPGFDGHPSRGAWLIRRMGDGTFVRHTATRGSRQVRIGVVVDASTVRWYLPGRAEPEQDWIFREENLGARDLVLEVLAHDPALANFTQPVRTYLYPHGVLREGLAEIAALDVDLSGKVQRIAQKHIEDHTHQDMTNPWARVLYDGLSGGLEVARASEARSRATLDATLAQVRAQAAAGAVGTQRPATSAGGPATNGAGAPVSGGQHAAGDSVSVQGVAGPAGQAATGTASPAAAQPLRFVLMIGMRNLPGDARNPTCYSNVITRPGPPGWGARGSLPSGSAEQALREIDALKGAFIAACRASGREITSEGNFRHVRNQLSGDEERVNTTGPRFPEDVAVVLH